VLKRGLVLALTGVGIGLVLSALASRGLTLGIGIASFNVPLVAGASGALLAAAAFGAFLPARRASLLDPNVVLRQE
jgi:ABC-type antimicrobial peptide transport system permease subunit